MTLWGILQDYEVVDEDMNEAQIKKRGGQMLELYNRPKRSFSVSAIADLSVRGGRALYRDRRRGREILLHSRRSHARPFERNNVLEIKGGVIWDFLKL